MNGNNKLIRQFITDGIKFMFGNPGTVEEGFLDALGSYTDFKYITCLHESVAVAMADGYSRMTGNPSVVQLHSGVGLGNGIGMIYQAMRGHSPLVIIAGEAGVKYDSMDAQMACDLVDMAKPVTKWAGRVVHKDSLLRMVRRAVKIALTPPQGPVFLALPLDILDEENEEDIIPASIPHTGVTAGQSDINQAADWLNGASEPIFIIGDGIAFSHAQYELENLADTIGAKVYGADYSQFNFNTLNPLFMGSLGHMFGRNSKSKIENADVILVSGTYLLPEVFPCLGNIFKRGAKIIHIDLNAYEIAKNHPVDLGIVADPKCTIREINNRISSLQTMHQKQEAIRRRKDKREFKPFDETNIAEAFMKQVSEKVDGDYVIFDEALTSSPHLEKYFPMQKEGTYFQTRGGSLGVGIPGALGIKLASPNQTVLAFTGDGGSMYTIQALHTAVRYGIDIKIIILNNGKYQLLRDNIDRYWSERGMGGHSYPDCFNLEPVIDFVTLAKSMGVSDGIKIERIDDIESGVEKMLSSKETFIVDLIIG